ncbi:MAG: hypothetical protein LC670_06105 [Flavobacteriales bacterium]|nr:hypothetical protein [Flavobacteriales bacterium]
MTNSFTRSIIVFLLITAVSAPQALLAQSSGWDDDVPSPVYVDVRAEVGIMTADNVAAEGFAQVRPTFWGVHGEVGYKFDNFSVFSGAGFSFMPFRQSQSSAFGESTDLGVIPAETVESSLTYFSIQVPVGISYSFGRAFSAHVALNMNFMNAISSRHDINDNRIPDEVYRMKCPLSHLRKWTIPTPGNLFPKPLSVLTTISEAA